MLSAVRYERGTWSAILKHGCQKYLRRRATTVIASWFVGHAASAVHRRPNSGVKFITNSQFTIRTSGRKVKPDWPRIGKACFKVNTQA